MCILFKNILFKLETYSFKTPGSNVYIIKRILLKLEVDIFKIPAFNMHFTNENLFFN